VPSPAPAPAPTGGEPTATPPAGLSTEHQQRWREIMTRVVEIDRVDYYAILGVDRKAPVDQIQSAFFRLAKAWHPDRLPTELQPLKSYASKLFTRVNEANSTLTDNAKRANYDQSLAVGGGTADEAEQVQRVIDAALEFQKAEVFMKKNDLIQAELLCKRAAAADPEQPDYRVLLAWIQAMRKGEPPPLSEGKTTSFYDDSIRVLDGVIVANPKFEKALAYRGMLLKRAGYHDRALQDFRRVVEINPKNVDAVREVRLHQMRKDTAKKAEDDQGGLLNKLFRK
jgi:curved DNA-binding protein CbpA